LIFSGGLEYKNKDRRFFIKKNRIFSLSGRQRIKEEPPKEDVFTVRNIFRDFILRSIPRYFKPFALTFLKKT